MTQETFDKGCIEQAIKDFLGMGEDSEGIAHRGYFSGSGWAARCLRYHLAQLQKDVPQTADQPTPTTRL